jgi:hypothetical protein
LFLLQTSIGNAHKALLATLLVAFIFITGCQGNDPDSFTVTVEALTQPNQYQTHFKWNVNNDDGDHWIIQRQSDNAALSNVGTVSHDTHDFVDTTVVAGTTYHYGLASDDSDPATVKKSLDITIPRDLSIAGTTSLASVSGIGRLMIPKGSKIITSGKDLEISVDQIISTGGSVETFPNGQTAAANTAGRPGGQIKIHARTGTGSLTVVARGENGGPSSVVGPRGATGYPGGQGLNAICGFKDNDAACGMNPSDYGQLQQKCNQGGIFGALYCQILGRFYCKMQPGNGGQGSQGQHGGVGGPGVSGGDSGNMLIEIADNQNIQVTPVSIPGAGGLGGPGGPGGYGGNSGPPGNRDPLGICRGFGHWGLPGALGPTGPQGPSGSPGANGATCLRFGANSSGDCSKFQILFFLWPLQLLWCH